MANTANNNLGVNPEQGGEKLVNPERRGFLKASVIATTALAVGMILPSKDAEAEEVQLAALNTETSPLWINYREIAQSPLDAMLANGENEWMTNAAASKGDRAVSLWKDSLVPWIIDERLSNRNVKQLEEYTPNLLLSFLNLSPDEYPWLHQLWKNEEARRMLQRSQEIRGVIKG